MSTFMINTALIFFALTFVVVVGFAFRYAYVAITEKSVEERQREAVAGFGKKTPTHSNLNYRR